MNQPEFRPGFVDPVMDGQSVFRAALKALSRPGLIVDVPLLPPAPPPLHPAAAALALTLLDLDTPLWLDQELSTPEVKDWLRFHCGVRIVDAPDQAAFGLIDQGGEPVRPDRFNQGHPAYPDQSATLIIQVLGFDSGEEKILTGPGINGRISLAVQGLHKSFWPEWRRNQQGFPLGVDCFLASPGQVCGLPRTTRVEG